MVAHSLHQVSEEVLYSTYIASSPGVPWARRSAWCTLLVHTHDLKAITHSLVVFSSGLGFTCDVNARYACAGRECSRLKPVMATGDDTEFASCTYICTV